MTNSQGVPPLLPPRYRLFICRATSLLDTAASFEFAGM